MTIGIFTDKGHRPTEKEISSALGSSESKWNAILAAIRGDEGVQEDFRFMYGRKYGWAARFRLARRPLVLFYPNARYFVAQIILSRSQLFEVENRKLHENARRAIEEANLYDEGKWVFIPVRTSADVQDVKRLLALKKRQRRFA